MKIAVLGGSFNPPHYGHLFFANEVRTKLNFDRIIFSPTYISPHKNRNELALDFHRVEMLNLALRGISWAEVSDCDIKRGIVTRTVDTLKDIISIYKPDLKPGFIIGDDLLDDFHMWKNYKEILDLSSLIVGLRVKTVLREDIDYITVQNRIFPLSSSEIRERVNKNQTIDFLLPEKVVEYIYKNGLYRTDR